MSAEQLLSVFLIGIGVLLLLLSLIFVWRIFFLMRINSYSGVQWLIVSLLIIGFAVGYTFHLLIVLEYINPIVDPVLVVSGVYFAGSIFVIFAVRSSLNAVSMILGGRISEDTAIHMFLERIGSVDTNEFPHLSDQFSFKCNECNKDIHYTIADVIRQHSKLKDKGVSVQTTFGVHNFILRHSHICNEGRREMTLIHDNDLAYRAIDRSRIILGDGF